jgi:formylglycine-generating enzyme required for sulfatase activity
MRFALVLACAAGWTIVLFAPGVALAQLSAAAARPAATFRDCDGCPEMVLITGGTFLMGSSAAEQAWAVSHGATPRSVADESPQHNVSVRSFAMGRFDITRGEFAAFVRETGFTADDGCAHGARPRPAWTKDRGVTWQSPGFAQTDRDPVVCVTWHDAVAYVAWLNKRVRGAGASYRLPTEAEWEYAARGGTTTMFWWGDDDAGAADRAWFAANAGGVTHAVGAKPANPFGLYDIVGNAWQWTADCYAPDYSSAPVDGSAAGGAGTCLRVDRGGSYYYPTWLLRSAPRERNPADYRDVMIGFRVARSIP